MIKSKLGQFYVGDPCYVLSDEDYHGIWGDANNFEDGEIQLDEEKSFIVHGTYFGDGSYEDQLGNLYGVDSGTLSVIPLEACAKTGGLKYGKVFPGKEADLDYYEDGVFTIQVGDKNIIIQTGDEILEDEEDEEWYDYSEDEIDECKLTETKSYTINDVETAYNKYKDEVNLDEHCVLAIVLYSGQPGDDDSYVEETFYNINDLKKYASENNLSDDYWVRIEEGQYDDKEDDFESWNTWDCMLLENKNIVTENSTEEYWDAKELARRGFVALLKFNFDSDSEGNKYIVTSDGDEVVRFNADTDEDAIRIFDNKEYVKFESVDVELDEDADLMENLLNLVDVEAVVERIDELLKEIVPSEEPYITDTWVYDEVRLENEPLAPEDLPRYDDEDIYVYEDVADSNIKYDLDEDKIYHRTITMNGQKFDLMFKITDYYNCILKIYDIVEE